MPLEAINKITDDCDPAGAGLLEDEPEMASKEPETEVILLVHI